MQDARCESDATTAKWEIFSTREVNSLGGLNAMLCSRHIVEDGQ